MRFLRRLFSSLSSVPLQFRTDFKQAMTNKKRYERYGDRHALDEASAAWERIFSHQDFPSVSKDFQSKALNSGAIVFMYRFQSQGQLQDINRAVILWQTAFNRTPPNSPNLPLYLNNLGAGLRTRYAVSGQLADLEEAIYVTQSALNHIQPSSPDLAMYLNNFGNGLHDRYTHTGQLTDLEEAIRNFQEAVRRTRPNSPDLPGRLNNLGAGLRDRYISAGQSTDLEEAICAWHTAVNRTSTNSPDLAMYLDNLGNGLHDRYTRTGQLTDLEEAVRVYRTAVQHTPPNSPELPRHLNNLGIGLRDRYARTKQLADLEEVIRAYQLAISRTPPDSPNLSGMLNNLGLVLRDRYFRTKQMSDLEEAIRFTQKAVTRIPPHSPNLPLYLNNLGLVLSDRYAVTGQLVDLEETVRVHQTAVSRTPTDSPELPARLNNLGNGLRDWYSHTGQLTDMEAATRTYRASCQQGSQGQLEVTLMAARNWGNWALTRRAWLEAIEAYQYGLTALEQLYRIQTLRQSRQTWQKEAGNLVIALAYANARAGQSEQAVVILEQGRTRQLNERLARDQAQLEALAEQQIELVEQYRQLTDQLRQLEMTERQLPVGVAHPPDWDQHHQQIRIATTQLDALIAQIRQLPGYDSFLSQVSWGALVGMLHPDTPVLYLLATEAGSLGLLVRSGLEKQGVITPIWLDNFTEDDLSRFLVQREGSLVVGGYLPGQLGEWHWLRSALQEILPQLGAKLLAPIAEHLHQQNIKQLVIIPTGRLNLLPLHAASYTVDGQTEIFGDAFCISYVPSAQAVANSRRKLDSRPATPPTLLAIGDPQPVSAKPLIFSRHEVSEIMQYFPERGDLFLTTEATLTAVRTRLAQASHIHFSCHGLFDPKQPLQSGLFFSHDERLTLANLLDETELTTARLAILSACQTAINDFNNLPDEVIGLPTGFLQAGVPGVIGTLWPVNDHSTALLMVRFYQYYMKGEERLSPAAALQKAQHWLRNATRQEIGDYYHSFIRMSADEASAWHWEMHKEGKPDDQPYAHPFYWAAFVFTGV